jgi:hypothetical protein
MKVGDLIEMRGSVGVLTDIKKNRFPPYQVWYRVRWQNKEPGHNWLTVCGSKYDPPLKKVIKNS